MRKTILLALPLSVILASQAVAQHDADAARPWVETPVPIAATALEWIDVDPEGMPGVRIAPVWGNPSTGAFGAFLRLPAGFASGLHTHTHPIKLVIVSGTYVQAPAGEAEFRLGPGSYLMQPGGSYRHVTKCAEDADCVFYMASDGAFDLHEANETGDSGS